ncbi:AAA family ATPase [Pengzhenrongella frigida]|uniref:Chromosome partitioning protein n=1 Tax=Pengzhenrongella frigida TaxID=1259133 RepID=A0A4Q5MZ11_9MICO|nr:hypothetical protein [Cellulomonas sp. HLT2-17]RYV50173.1 hypothetical protein EUA98_15005 [Cellulomonas sp. HLT2-17]
MTPPVGVLCAVRGAGEAAVATALDGAANRITVMRRCADLAELLAAAGAGLGRIAVVSADLPHLDREAVAQLHSGRFRVLALTAPEQVARALALGVDAVLDDDDPAGLRLVAAVLALAEAADEDLEPGPAALGPASGPATGPATDTADQLGGVAASPGQRARPPGKVVAVWGPTGAPGRSTIALNLAAELADAGSGGGSLVIDADTYGGTIGQLVAMLDEAPGLAAAARAAGQGGLDLAGLARLTPVLAPGLRVLTGISRANRWPELPASALEVVWEVARELAAWTVIDCGFCLEQDEALSYDTRAPRRNAATLSALEAADVVVVVGAGDPVGIQRLVRGLTDLATLPVAITGARMVVVNRVRASAAGPRPGVAIGQALGRYAGVDDPYLVPEDRAAVDAAVLRGATLLEVSPGSPARRAIAALATRIARPAAPAGRPAGGRRAAGFAHAG